MVDTFMEGIDPSYRNLEESYLTELFTEYTEIITGNMAKYNDKEKHNLKKKITSNSR